MTSCDWCKKECRDFYFCSIECQNAWLDQWEVKAEDCPCFMGGSCPTDYKHKEEA